MTTETRIVVIVLLPTENDEKQAAVAAAAAAARLSFTPAESRALHGFKSYILSLLDCCLSHHHNSMLSILLLYLDGAGVTAMFPL